MNNSGNQELKQSFLLKTKNKDAFAHVELVVSELKFFKEKQQLFDPFLYQQLIRKVQLSTYKQGDVVFHYGSDNVELFYVMLQGSVAILCPKNNNITHQQVIEEYNQGINNDDQHLQSPKIQHNALKDIIRAQAYASFLGINIKSIDRQSFEQEYLENHREIKMDKWLDNCVHKLFPSMKVVNMCHQGDSFGEIALIGNVQRTATVLCVNECLIVTLANPDFQNILKQYHQQVKQEKIALLNTFPLFSRLQSSKMKNVVENIIVQKPKMFNVIYNEGTKPEFMYFIKSGEVELLKIISKTKIVSISLLQVGCSFGYEEIRQNIPREYRAISKSSQCELYLIPMEIVLQLNNGKQDEQSITQNNYFHQRLNRLLSDRPQQKRKFKQSPDSIENYRLFFDKDFDCITRTKMKKKIISPKHKKMISEPFQPFFKIDMKKLKRSSISINQMVPNLKQSVEQSSKHSKQNSSSQINIHRHLFSPRITKRQLDVKMPFKNCKLTNYV